MSAAGHTELAQLNRRAAVTLFNMPESIERAVDLRLRELKIEAPDARGHIPEALLSRGPPDLGERITEEIGEPPNEAARSGWTQEGDRLYIGEISEARLMEGDGFEETIGCLAWAYHSMKEGSLIVPYLTLNGGGHQ